MRRPTPGPPRRSTGSNLGVDRLARGELIAVILAVMSSSRARSGWRATSTFLGDDREAAPGVSGARRLDRGVECEQIGLPGDVADQPESFARLDVVRQRLADLDRLACLPPARVATSDATSTSVRASSIARISPAAVCAASRIATADCSAAAATSLVLPSMPRADAEVTPAWARSCSLSRVQFWTTPSTFWLNAAACWPCVASLSARVIEMAWWMKASPR